MTILLNLLRTLYFTNYSFPIVTFSGRSSTNVSWLSSRTRATGGSSLLPCSWKMWPVCLSQDRSCLWTQPWNHRVLLIPLRWYSWLDPVKASIYTFKILMDGYRDLPLQLPKTSKFPCLLKLPPANLEWSASFLHLSLDLCVQRLVCKSRNRGHFPPLFLNSAVDCC